MKKKLVFILFLVLVVMGYGQEAWMKKGIKLPPTVCYASPKSYHSFVHPLKENLKSGLLKSAQIEVTYIGFSPEAQAAFQYAVDIWKNLIYSPVPIRIQANWTSLASNVLGSCGPSDYFKNFNSTQIWNCYYPVALVEKMLGKEVNASGDFDMLAEFNKDFNWYYGTDGNTPSTKYDLVSTVLHELTHGLGYSGFFDTSRGRGFYGSDGFSAVYDQYVVNKAGNKLVNTNLFANPSVVLYTNLTSGWLEFSTKLVDTGLPRIFAPSTWDSGSSIYHLDDATYPTGDPNSLMTPYTGKGEAIHDPGPNSLAMIYEIGWKNISISHQPLKDMEFVPSPINVDVKIQSDYDLDSTKTYLYYLTGKFTKTDSVKLIATKIPTVFNAKLPQTLDGEVHYYISATDVKKRKYFFPSGAPTRYLTFKIGVDKEAPILIHEPVKYLINTNPSVKIEANVTDNIGVKSVKVEYFVNGGGIKEFALKNDSADVYSGDMVFPAASVKDGDVVSYRILATDVSSQSNVGKTPLSGYYKFNIEGFNAPADKYVNNLDVDTHDFIGTDFSISTVTGFASAALNSAHPYLSPEVDNVNYNFISILKYPIILKLGGKMTFDEIALVEPGDAGTKFGDANFFDYVIVEGSKDDGLTWKPLVDGYDCNAQKSWADLYNGSISGQNSTAVPTKDLFVKREIDLLANGNFKAGETIQIRFRLFSDPYAHGWGWIIDNLSIQDFGTAINPKIISEGEVLLSPNPATDKVNLQIQAKENFNRLHLKVYNSSGIIVYDQAFLVDSNLFQTEINVNNFAAGLYLFAIEPDNGRTITRKILVK